MKLVLAEKPSVAQSIAKVIGAVSRKDGYLEGNGYIVSWCVGHLVELAEPETYDEKYKKWTYDDLPIMPSKWKYEVSSVTRKQFGVLKNLMKREDVDCLVCATDAGREGELIFRLVYHQCHCTKPFERLWISSMEDRTIKDGFENLKPSSAYDRLYEAALCRERADWLVGINATRLFSCLYKQSLNVGRVMTPTLAMTVQREAAISAFKEESFYTVEVGCEGFTAISERYQEKEEAEADRKKCEANGTIEVIKVQTKEKSEKAPALYDLTSLQRDSNRLLGYTAKQTLDYAQSLYEKKLITYPRTDSRFITEDMENGLSELLETTQKFINKELAEVETKQIINNKKVTDHHAILPTKEIASTNVSELPSGELAILNLICQRLLVSVSKPHIFEETTVELACGSLPFKAKGKTVLSKGWNVLNPKEEKEKNQIPKLCDGDILNIQKVEVKEGKTSPPKHFTEDTLLKTMEGAGSDALDKDTVVERKGLGTPATRAGIIENLIYKGFVERDKKNLIATHKGINLVTIVSDTFKSAKTTAEWEMKLSDIASGKASKDEFLKGIEKEIRDTIKQYSDAVKL